MFTMNINTKATSRFFTNHDRFVLVREEAGKVMIRPTYRNVNKYIKEQARKVTRKNNGKACKIAIKANLESGKKYIMEPRKYGWFKLVEVNTVSLNDSYVSVS